ncbi:MAG: hypothetical protein KAW09_04940 [Thermoplasmata archaeon]|nr:hypothetical protein [Thermoplasmata archaeon]
MKSFWRNALVEEENEITEESTTYLTYFSVIGGSVLVGLSIRNYIWSRRFAAGRTPSRVVDPGRMLKAFRTVHIVGFSASV